MQVFRTMEGVHILSEGGGNVRNGQHKLLQPWDKVTHILSTVKGRDMVRKSSMAMGHVYALAEGGKSQEMVSTRF